MSVPRSADNQRRNDETSDTFTDAVFQKKRGEDIHFACVRKCNAIFKPLLVRNTHHGAVSLVATQRLPHVSFSPFRFSFFFLLKENKKNVINMVFVYLPVRSGYSVPNWFSEPSSIAICLCFYVLF